VLGIAVVLLGVAVIGLAGVVLFESRQSYKLWLWQLDKDERIVGVLKDLLGREVK
jgi:Tfp pilus assembly protein PilV